MNIVTQFPVTDHSSHDVERARVHVGNHYALSIARGPYTYGGHEGLYECAVMYKDTLNYDTPIMDDVIGYCSEQDVMRLIQELQEFANK